MPASSSGPVSTGPASTPTRTGPASTLSPISPKSWHRLLANPRGRPRLHDLGRRHDRSVPWRTRRWRRTASGCLRRSSTSRACPSPSPPVCASLTSCTVHPRRYLEGLANALVAAGGTIHEHSRVTHVGGGARPGHGRDRRWRGRGSQRGGGHAPAHRSARRLLRAHPSEPVLRTGRAPAPRGAPRDDDLGRRAGALDALVAGRWARGADRRGRRARGRRRRRHGGPLRGPRAVDPRDLRGGRGVAPVERARLRDARPRPVCRAQPAPPARPCRNGASESGGSPTAARLVLMLSDLLAGRAPAWLPSSTRAAPTACDRCRRSSPATSRSPRSS